MKESFLTWLHVGGLFALAVSAGLFRTHKVLLAGLRRRNELTATRARE